ncbi:MAG: hypothetical protein JNM66_16390 [Bryobacterales bacterium]|nr:hypothetical protein [Bryobacterales bacterium]
MLRLFWISLFVSASLLADARISALVYDTETPQAAFAANEIVAASGRAIPQFGAAGGETPCSPCVVMQLAANGKAAQSYSIQRQRGGGRDVIRVVAPDANGLLYGGLEIAEAVRLGGIDGLKDSEHTPHIARRGIKFNIPLDVRTPSYSDNADAAQANIPEMWSFDFWREFLDEMARHRYNTLSLWNLHPFPSMVKVPEFPDVALRDVKRTRVRMDETYSHNGTDMVRPELLKDMETVRVMSMEDKIRFWRDVMQYAKDRGIATYVITWNIFTFGTDGKYGITPAQDNLKTIEYFRASVRELVLTYPLLAGIGVTAGEEMRNRNDEFSKEKWLWKTYGEGVRDALKIQPGRKVDFIHRYHQTAQGEIFNAFKDYPGTFDLSFKYSIAHMYSIPNPPYIQEVLPQLPAGKRTWLTVRNDDIYSFRWGNPQYAREYIQNIPPADKIAGFYMGPDGFTWGRDFLGKSANGPRPLVISKQWYSFLMWGRLAYDPKLPDSRFQAILASRFPGTDAGALAGAWASASQVFPLITRFMWGDIDLRWFPEACLSHPRYKGFYTVRDFMEGSPMPGSNVLAILPWRKAKLGNQAMAGTTPLEIATALEQASTNALRALPGLRGAGVEGELAATLSDVEAMALLAHYYSLKIRAAAALALYDRSGNAAEQKEAVDLLTEAVATWRSYARVYTSQYTTPHLYNRVGYVDMLGLTARTQDDVRMAQNWQVGSMPQDAPRAGRNDRPFEK